MTRAAAQNIRLLSSHAGGYPAAPHNNAGIPVGLR